MDTAPILVLGFRRSENIGNIIDAIRPSLPKLVYFAVDGPRQGHPDDALLVIKTQKAINAIDWDCEVSTLFRVENLGLRHAVPEAVSWVLAEQKSVIVIEDDAIPGTELLEFMSSQLILHEPNPKVAHVSGYNLVPKSQISNKDSATRGSIYPESYLWGTWSRAWIHYDDNLPDLGNLLKNSNLSTYAKIIWWLNFRMAQKNLINTWAYRWIASMWREDLHCISPNMNLTTYVGQDDGTHTKRKSRIIELPVLSINPYLDGPDVSIDQHADTWVSKNVFHASAFGVIEQSAVFTILSLFKFSEKIKSKFV